jgi:uncharacterized protein (DUF433 family)
LNSDFGIIEKDKNGGKYMSTGVIHPYITSKAEIGRGRPIITGTRMKVSNIVAYYKLGFSPEELAREFPHLNLSQIHDALSYYYENQEDIDNEIDEDSEENIKKLVQK